METVDLARVIKEILNEPVEVILPDKPLKRSFDVEVNREENLNKTIAEIKQMVDDSYDEIAKVGDYITYDDIENIRKQLIYQNSLRVYKLITVFYPQYSESKIEEFWTTLDSIELPVMPKLSILDYLDIIGEISINPDEIERIKEFDKCESPVANLLNDIAANKGHVGIDFYKLTSAEMVEYCITGDDTIIKQNIKNRAGKQQVLPDSTYEELVKDYIEYFDFNKYNPTNIVAMKKIFNIVFYRQNILEDVHRLRIVVNAIYKLLS